MTGVRATDPLSSREAAQIAPVAPQEAKVLGYLSEHGEATADDLEAASLHSVHRSIWSSRLSGLYEKGMVCQTGWAYPKRRRVMVFALTEKGRKLAAG